MLVFGDGLGLFGFVLEGGPVGEGDGLVADDGVGADFLVVLFEFGSQLAELGVVLVEHEAVLDDLVDVGVELCRGVVDAVLQVGLDRGQVHGLLDYFEVVGDALGDGVDRIPEGPGRLVAFEHLEDFEAGLHGVFHVLVVDLAAGAVVVGEDVEVVGVLDGAVGLFRSLGHGLEGFGEGFLFDAVFFAVVLAFVFGLAVDLEGVGDGEYFHDGIGLADGEFEVECLP